jgi:hypothetical protein
VNTINEPESSSQTSLDTNNETESAAHLSSSLLVHSRQVKWEYSDTILDGTDY